MAETFFTVVPVTPAFDANGTPYSPEYGDVYHSADSGPGQARHVFLGGNDLPARWSGQRVFTIVETGFGLGLNFLATWDAWRRSPEHCARLHFVSIEKHPFTRDGLAVLHARYPEFAHLASRLQQAWPLPLSGLHRLDFDDGAVTLTLAIADAVNVLPSLRLGADAFYLDGYAPARNPDMWSANLMKRLARMALPGATAATYTSARSVRDALSAAGFACVLRPGFGRKRHMIAARYAPRWTPRHRALAAPDWPERSAIIIGAGLAGAATAERLAARGWRISLIERHAAPAAEASGLCAGLYHPLLARDDSILARLSRAGFLYSLARWRALQSQGHGFEWHRCGLLQLARDGREEIRMQNAISALRVPAAFAEYLGKTAAAERAGREVAGGGLWFGDGGWIRPSSLVEAELARARSGAAGWSFHAGCEVHRVSCKDERWHAIAADGTTIAAAPVCILANAHEAARLAAFGSPRLKRVRGQLTRLPPGSCGTLTAALAGTATLATAPSIAIAGASYEPDSVEPAPSIESHAGNLARLRQLLPQLPPIDAAMLSGEVGFRCVSPDRLPLIGTVPDLSAVGAAGRTLAGAQLGDLPRLAGLYAASAYASRGLTWSALGGEMLASLIEGEPLPIEADLGDAVDPARFLLKLVRRGTP